MPETKLGTSRRDFQKCTCSMVCVKSKVADMFMGAGCCHGFSSLGMLGPWAGEAGCQLERLVGFAGLVGMGWADRAG